MRLLKLAPSFCFFTDIDGERSIELKAIREMAEDVEKISFDYLMKKVKQERLQSQVNKIGIQDESI